MKLGRRSALAIGAALVSGIAALEGREGHCQVRDLLTVQIGSQSGRAIVNRAQWAARREQILKAMQRVMGPLPGAERRVPLDILVEREERTERYVRRKLTYQSAPGERVPAWLLIPLTRKGKAPAMLVLHQTSAEAKDEVVGPVGLANLHIGHELAELGYIVLAPDYPTLGEHKIDVYQHGWPSGSMKAIWDNMRGVDLLQAMPEVDGKRIGVIGHSLGGHNGLFTAAFDKRLRCVVTNCGFTSFAKYYGGDLSGWAGYRYMPRIKSEFPTPEKMPFAFHDVLGAIAPRPLYVSAPLYDGNFDVSGVRDVVASALPVYSLLGASGNLTAVYPDCGHDWPPAERSEVYRWLNRQLRLSSDTSAAKR